MNQYEILHKFNDEHRTKFNPEFFNRTNKTTIEAIKQIVLSCQREKFFTIKVVSFKIIEDYDEINTLLREYEEKLSNNKNKSKKRDNQYAFINLKDSDIMLMVVRYYIAINDESEYVNVYIAIPRIVDKYYFRIFGNYYSAMYQIVDGSTYNNTASNSKIHSVTLKTLFMPIRIYREVFELHTTSKEVVKCTYYKSRIFNKTLGVMKYIMAKFGYYEGLKFLRSDSIKITDYDPENDDLYTFLNKNKLLYISVPKIIFDGSNVIQSLVYTINKSIDKNTTLNDIFTTEFWIESLGSEFNNQTIQKGLAILDSLEYIYDSITKNIIHLPDESKEDIYCILRWMIGEFSNLRLKDNLDISTKRIRYSEYIASLYAIKLSRGLYRVSDIGKKANINTIKKAIMTGPLYLLTMLSNKCKLVNIRNLVSDMDTITAMKFTYKGIAGIGESNNSSVPNIYRSVNVSHIGRLDLDTSSATDPGMSGILCPLNKLYDNMFFSDYKEPNFWDSEVDKLVTTYKTAAGLRELMLFKDDVLDQDHTDEIKRIEENLQNTKQLSNLFVRATDGTELNGLPLEGSGTIQYEEE